MALVARYSAAGAAPSLARLVAAPIALILHLALNPTVSAQQPWLPAPDRAAPRGPNRISLEAGLLGVSLGYARRTAAGVELGVAASGGAQTGFMVGSSELTGDASMPLFVELLGAAAFVRGDVGRRTELEGGVRAGWFYHSTEYETIFSGVYAAVQYRAGAVRLGPRVYGGRIAEESGRSEVRLAVVPLLVGLRWSW